MKKIALLGYGKMGKTIDALAKGAGHEVVLRINSQNPMSLMSAETLATADVAIEFSRPELAVGHIMACLRAGVPVVVGTTGWLDRLAEVQAACEAHQGAVLYASNFSVGVNIAFAVNRYLASIMAHHPSYRPSITETHHIHKLDAPSGTALTLAEDMVAALPNIRRILHRPDDSEDGLPVISFREGEVPGTHEVSYVSAIDSITLCHTAHTREGFAQGALLAASWLVGRQGFYGMASVLGLEE